MNREMLYDQSYLLARQAHAKADGIWSSLLTTNERVFALEQELERLRSIIEQAGLSSSNGTDAKSNRVEGDSNGD